MSDRLNQSQDSYPVTPATPIRAVVWDVVSAIAPKELPYLQGAEGISDPVIVRQLQQGGKSNRTLGFGTDQVIAVVTAAVWLALNTAAQEVVKAGLSKGHSRTKALVRKVARRPAVATVMPPLSSGNLDLIEQIVLQEVKLRTDLPEGQGEAIAKAVRTRLAGGEIPPDAPTSSPGEEE